MKTAQDFIVEIPVLKPGDQITKARQILRDDRFREVYVVDAKKTLQNVMLGQPGPEVLLLAVKIERAVGSRDAEASYALQLRRKFPDSEQTKLLQNGGE